MNDILAVALVVGISLAVAGWSRAVRVCALPTLLDARHNPRLRDRLFFGTIALALCHGTYLLSSSFG